MEWLIRVELVLNLRSWACIAVLTMTAFEENIQNAMWPQESREQVQAKFCTQQALEELEPQTVHKVFMSINTQKIQTGVWGCQGCLFSSHQGCLCAWLALDAKPSPFSQPKNISLQQAKRTSCLSDLRCLFVPPWKREIVGYSFITLWLMPDTFQDLSLMFS